MRSLLLGWALGLSLFAAPAAAQTFPKLAGAPVVDQADIIPAAEEAALNTQLLDLEKKPGTNSSSRRSATWRAATSPTMVIGSAANGRSAMPRKTTASFS